MPSWGTKISHAMWSNRASTIQLESVHHNERSWRTQWRFPDVAIKTQRSQKKKKKKKVYESGFGVWKKHTGEGVGFNKCCCGLHIGVYFYIYWASLVAQMVRKLPVMQETWAQSLEKGMTSYSSNLAWRSTWTEETGGLQSMGVAKQWTRLSN